MINNRSNLGTKKLLKKYFSFYYLHNYISLKPLNKSTGLKYLRHPSFQISIKFQIKFQSFISVLKIETLTTSEMLS